MNIVAFHTFTHTWANMWMFLLEKKLLGHRVGTHSSSVNVLSCVSTRVSEDSTCSCLYPHAFLFAFLLESFECVWNSILYGFSCELVKLNSCLFIYGTRNQTYNFMLTRQALCCFSFINLFTFDLHIFVKALFNLFSPFKNIFSAFLIYRHSLWILNKNP